MFTCCICQQNPVRGETGLDAICAKCMNPTPPSPWSGNVRPDADTDRQARGCTQVGD